MMEKIFTPVSQTMSSHLLKILIKSKGLLLFKGFKY